MVDIVNATPASASTEGGTAVGDTLDKDERLDAFVH